VFAGLEQVFQHRLRPRRQRLGGKAAFAQLPDRVERGDTDDLRQGEQVFLVASAGGERLHREHMLRRRRQHPNPGMIEHLPFLGGR